MNAGEPIEGGGQPAGRVIPLPYATSGVADRGRFWAWAFLLSGGYALVCVPAVFVFEHFRWHEAPLHLSSFAAWVICPISAVFYLARNRGGRDRESVGARRTRTLAYLALGLAAAMLLFVVALVILVMTGPGLDD